MPRKSLVERTRRAKKAGTKVTVTGDDLGAASHGRSKHSTKKSAHVAAFAEPEDRSVSKREPPGRGKALDRKMEKVTHEKPRWTEKRAPRLESARTATSGQASTSRKTPPKRLADGEGTTPRVTKTGKLTKQTRSYLSGRRTKR